MGLDPELRELMHNEVKLERKIGVDRFGSDRYAPPVMAPCRLDGRTREVVRSDGSTSAAIGRVFLAEIYPWLDDATNLHVPSMNPKDNGWLWAEIVGIDTLYDEDGSPYCQIISYGAR